MRHLICHTLLLISLQACLSAAPLETPFFTWEVPEGWTVSRNTSGLWQVTAPGSNPMEAVVSVARLSTTPEAYLQGTSSLWRSLGTVEPLQPWLTDRPNQAWFLVKHTAEANAVAMSTVKWVRWRGPLLVVTSFKAPSDALKSWAPKIRSLALNQMLEKPEYEEAELREEVKNVLRNQEDSPETLTDVDAIKLAMNVARQDWEPFFGSGKNPAGPAVPLLFETYLAYLEARYDASFAIVHGPQLGMGPDIVESRLRSVAVRRDELRRELQGF